MTRLLRYVVHARIADYLALGWMVVADLGPMHGAYSVLMAWPCDCAAPEPQSWSYLDGLAQSLAQEAA